jgi:hypothetical protein
MQAQVFVTNRYSQVHPIRLEGFTHAVDESPPLWKSVIVTVMGNFLGLLPNLWYLKVHTTVVRRKVSC